MRTVCGVGINDCRGGSWSNGKPTKCYSTWRLMLQRCYNKEFLETQPTYVGSSVCEDWLKFSNFKEWFDKNYPTSLAENLGIKFELDKDLLANKNKEYSPEACVFLPKKVNAFLANKLSSNSSGYTGVSLYKSTGKWEVHIRDFNSGNNRHLGYFESKEDASKAYQLAREVEAEKAKDFLKELGYPTYVIDKVV